MHTPCSAALVLALATLAPAAAPAPRPVRLEVTPERIILAHADDQARLVVTAVFADDRRADYTRAVSTSDSALVSVSEDGVVRPRKVGSATIAVRSGGVSISVPVEVKSVDRPQVSFANDIVPVLARYGCNSGACHGAASGKKGFKVSLLGYDPVSDHATLTRGSLGRRLDHLEPAKSLMLTKPAGLVSHDGSKRFDIDSEPADLLRRWIAEGAKSDLAVAAKIVGIDVFPTFRTYASPGGSQQLLVRAKYGDGSVRDVTRLARFSSNNELAVTINDDGRAALLEKGEAALMVRFGAFVAVSNLVVLKHDPAFRWSAPPENNYIDKHVFVKLKAMEILPSEVCTDEEFLRRVSYDLIGLPPSPSEIRAFVADTKPDKRSRKIDELLARTEYAEVWAGKWADLLRLRFDTSGDKGTWSAYRWLRDSIAANKPYDRFVRELLTAEGSSERNAPATYFRVFANTEDAVEATAQIFLGVRLMCARCHDHPFEKWVQKDYHSFAAFFSQVGRKAGRSPGEQVIFRRSVAATARHPLTGEVLEPKVLDGPSTPVDDKQDARTSLAAWLTAKDNPFFARSAVNRVWSQFFHRGIIDPVDDIRSSNPPSNAALLDALAKDFTESGFDVRRLIRTICTSRTYQLSARTTPSNAEDRSNFSHAVPRRLTAEQLIDTLYEITSVRESYRNRVPGAPTVALPVTGVRASQIPDRLLTSEMLDLFGRPKGESSCSCERSDEANLAQALKLIAGSSIHERIISPGSNVNRLIQTPGLSDEKLCEELYLRVQCRFPTAKEKAVIVKYLADKSKTDKSKDAPTKPGANPRLEAAQDVVWALLNTRGFLFNH